MRRRLSFDESLVYLAMFAILVVLVVSGVQWFVGK